MELNKNWAYKELSAVNFGDKRLKVRGVQLLKALSDSPQSSIPEACGSWKETIGAYRFLENSKVTHGEILNSHSIATLERIKTEKKILAIQDTSSLNYSTLSKTTGLGEVGDSTNGNAQGLIFHSNYIVSSSGVPLGLLDQQIWSRAKSQFKDDVIRAKSPIEKKESYKWIQSLKNVSLILPSIKDTTEVIHVMDREADIYQLFSESILLEESFLIRLKHNRRINKTSRGSSDGELIKEKLFRKKPIKTVKLSIPSRGSINQRRTASVQLRFMKFSLTAPRSKSIKQHNVTDEPLELTVISARETHPKGKESPINWILITNTEIKDSDDIEEAIRFYCLRWQIEVFHRILKTGCKVEACRFATSKKIENYVGILSIVAWNLHWITLSSRYGPKQKPGIIFTEREQKILCGISKVRLTKNMKLMDFIIMLAKQGGFLARKNDGFPGPEVLWRGWIKLKDLSENLDRMGLL